MHTIDGSDGYSYYFDPDLVGAVAIADGNGKTFYMPAQDMIHIVGEWAKRNKIAEIESMSAHTFLKKFDV